MIDRAAHKKRGIAKAQELRQEHLAGRIPDYEQVLSDGYHRFLKPGGIVLDVGAAYGSHLEQFVKIVGATGKIIGAEPIPGHARSLQERFADHKNVAVHAVALGDMSGQSTFHHISKMPWYSGLQRREFGSDSPSELIEVTVTTADELVSGLSRLDYMKVDIEGGDVDCLKGARRTLARLRPIVSVEYGASAYEKYGHNKHTLFDLASEAGYLLSDLYGNVVVDADQWEQVCDVAFWDYWLIPQERLEWWDNLFSQGR